MPADNKAEEAIPRGVQKRLGKLQTRRQIAEFREEQAELRIKKLETPSAKTEGASDVADTSIHH